MYKTKILVADDAVTMRTIVSKLLADWNYDFTMVINGLEALEKVDSERFDLILMDLEMPVMDGLTATKKIRRHVNEGKRNIPIIAISFSINSKNQTRLGDAGLDDFLPKPINPALLKAKIEKCLKKVN